MTNISSTVQIETRIKHDLSIAFQSVVGELSINVGTLVILSLCLSNAAARGGVVSNVKGWGEIVAQGGQAEWARQMMQRRFFPDGLSPEVHAWYTRYHETCSMDATLALADLLLASDLTPRLPEIKVPTLLLAPEASPFIPLEIMASMRAAIPDSELQVFAHAKHGLPLSHGRECAQVLRDFLQRTHTQ